MLLYDDDVKVIGMEYSLTTSVSVQDVVVIIYIHCGCTRCKNSSLNLRIQLGPGNQLIHIDFWSTVVSFVLSNHSLSLYPRERHLAVCSTLILC